jgi:ankyrin repeat protein
MRLLNLLSTYDYETSWRQIRKTGSTLLYTRDSKYQDWKSHSNSNSLLYTGQIGCGKSVLLANIVDDLLLTQLSKGAVIAFFFCKHDILESLEARTIYNSLALQLLRPIQHSLEFSESLDTCTSQLHEGDVLNILQTNIPSTSKAYFVIDGLDEVDNAERESLVDALRKLQEVINLSVCVSSRIKANGVSNMGLQRFVLTKTVSIPKQNPDIDVFIDAELESRIQSGKLVIGDPILVLDIRNALRIGSQGMFLWVVLQIASLCLMKTDEAIRQALTDLSKDLSETFSRILRRSAELASSHQAPMLEFIAVSLRPLTLEELREALSVVPGRDVWDPSKLFNDINLMVMCCGGLVIVDEEESTVRLVHHSFKQYLLGDLNGSPISSFTVDNAQKKMASVVVTYLSYGIFGTQLSVKRVPQIQAASAAKNIVQSVLPASSKTQAMALALLRSSKLSNIDISATLAKAQALSQVQSVIHFRFYEYTKVFWSQHVAYLPEDDPVIHKLFLKLLKKENVGVDLQLTTAQGQNLLMRAIESNKNVLVKALLDSGRVVHEFTNPDGRTPVSLAVQRGFSSILLTLLDFGKYEPASIDGGPLLWLAMRTGHDTDISILLSRQELTIDPNLEDEEGNTPLLWAVQHGTEAVVNSLIANFPFSTKSRNQTYEAALVKAVDADNQALIQVLLNSGKWDINHADESGQSAFFKAVKDGNEKLFLILLADPAVRRGQADSKLRTPLMVAAEAGHEAMVSALLESSQCRYDAKDKQNKTALRYAIDGGHVSIVKLLKDYETRDLWRFIDLMAILLLSLKVIELVFTAFYWVLSPIIELVAPVFWASRRAIELLDEYL